MPAWPVGTYGAASIRRDRQLFLVTRIIHEGRAKKRALQQNSWVFSGSGGALGQTGMGMS